VKSIPFALALGTLLACSTGSSTAMQPTTIKVPLTSDAETPPCTAAGADAKGTATVIIPVDNTSVEVTVSYEGLSGPATAAHVHLGTAIAAGPVVLPFKDSLASPFSKTFVASDYVAATGAPPDFAAFVVALKAGGVAYINVHTAACKGGEIRGEIR
jgi:CHRD domain